jgi:hypothetical protein
MWLLQENEVTTTRKIMAAARKKNMLLQISTWLPKEADQCCKKLSLAAARKTRCYKTTCDRYTKQQTVVE